MTVFPKLTFPMSSDSTCFIHFNFFTWNNYISINIPSISNDRLDSYCKANSWSLQLKMSSLSFDLLKSIVILIVIQVSQTSELCDFNRSASFKISWLQYNK